MYICWHYNKHLLFSSTQKHSCGILHSPAVDAVTWRALINVPATVAKVPAGRARTDYRKPRVWPLTFKGRDLGLYLTLRFYSLFLCLWSLKVATSDYSWPWDSTVTVFLCLWPWKFVTLDGIFWPWDSTVCFVHVSQSGGWIGHVNEKLKLWVQRSKILCRVPVRSKEESCVRVPVRISVRACPTGKDFSARRRVPRMRVPVAE
jgi:hypothetical protein